MYPIFVINIFPFKHYLSIVYLAPKCQYYKCGQKPWYNRLVSVILYLYCYANSTSFGNSASYGRSTISGNSASSGNSTSSDNSTSFGHSNSNIFLTVLFLVTVLVIVSMLWTS